MVPGDEEIKKTRGNCGYGYIRLSPENRDLRVRGAPALAIAGSLGVVVGMKDSKASTFSAFYKEFTKCICALTHLMKYVKVTVGGEDHGKNKYGKG